MNKKEDIYKLHQDRILEIAERLFFYKGIDGTTMDNIAKEADYSKTTIYTYFKSKSEILYTITYRSMAELKDILDIKVNGYVGFIDCFYAVCEALIEFQERYPLYFKIMLGTIDIDLNNALLTDIYNIGENINEIIYRLLIKGIEEGIVDDSIIFPDIVFILWSNITSIITLSDKKEKYINMGMSKSKEGFRNYGFSIVLQSILKGEKDYE